MERARGVPAAQISAGSGFASSLAEALQIIIVRPPQVTVTHFQPLPQQRPIIEGYPVIIERLDHPGSQRLDLRRRAEHSGQHNHQDCGRTADESCFARELPRTPPPPFRRGEGRREGSNFVWRFRGVKRVNLLNCFLHEDYLPASITTVPPAKSAGRRRIPSFPGLTFLPLTRALFTGPLPLTSSRSRPCRKRKSALTGGLPG